MKNKTFFIIPGFKQKANEKQFSWLREFLKQKNFEVIVADIKWSRRTMSNYIDDFKILYNKQKSNKNYVLGFSYGAVIALSTANELGPERIFLCSLSPDFKEDTSGLKPWLKKLVGKRRLADNQKRSAITLAKKLNTPSTIFYGEEEGRLYPTLKKRCEETARWAKKSKLVVIKNAPHKIDFPDYASAIKKEI